MIALLLLAAVAGVSGAGALTLAGLRAGSTWIERTLFGVLALGCGIGIASALYFLQRAAGLGSSRGLTIALQTGAAIALAVPFARAPRARAQLEREPLPLAIAILFAFLGARALLKLAQLLLAFPMGRWDALPIWNFHARHLYRGGDGFASAFDAIHGFSHPDYPVLLPGSVANAWTWMGGESVLAPAMIAAYFSIATAALLVLALLRRGLTNAALLAGMALFTIPFFAELGASEMADVPLSFWMLATSVSFVLPVEGPRRAAITGMCAAFAAWTKNEGVVFFALAGVVRLALSFANGGAKRAISDGIAFLAGAAPGLVCVAVFKLGFAPRGDMVPRGETFGRALDLSRHETVFHRGAYTLFAFGRSLVPNVLVPLAALLIGGVRPDWKKERGLVAIAALIAGMAMVYFATYVTTPQGLHWHMKFSIDRLFMQLWPSVLLLTFASMREAPVSARVPLRRIPAALAAWATANRAVSASIVAGVALGIAAVRVAPAPVVHGSSRAAEQTAAWFAEPVFPIPGDGKSGDVTAGHGSLTALASAWGSWPSPNMPRSSKAARWVTIACAAAALFVTARLAALLAGPPAVPGALVLLAALAFPWARGGAFHAADLLASVFFSAQLVLLVPLVRDRADVRLAHWTAFGAVSGLALAARPLGLLPIASLGAALALTTPRPPLRTTLRGAALAALIAAAIAAAFWPSLIAEPGAVLAALASADPAALAGGPASAIAPPAAFWVIVAASLAGLAGVRTAAFIALAAGALAVPVLLLIAGGSTAELGRSFVFIGPVIAAAGSNVMLVLYARFGRKAPAKHGVAAP